MTKIGTKEWWTLLKDDPTTLAAEVCSIDLVDLEGTLQKQASLRAWVGAAHEVAHINEERIKWDLKKTRAIVLLQLKKEEFAAQTVARKTKDALVPKTKTINEIEAEVDNSEPVKAIMTQLHAQQEVRLVLRTMTDALEHRKDMLIQISAKQRKEAEH